MGSAFWGCICVHVHLRVSFYVFQLCYFWKRRSQPACISKSPQCSLLPPFTLRPQYVRREARHLAIKKPSQQTQKKPHNLRYERCFKRGWLENCSCESISWSSLCYPWAILIYSSLHPEALAVWLAELGRAGNHCSGIAIISSWSLSCMPPPERRIFPISG